MPRYFFDTDDADYADVAAVPPYDNVGIMLIDDAAARDEALKALPDMARDMAVKNDDQRLVSVVRNAAGQVIYSATMTVMGCWHDKDADVIPLFPVKILWADPF